MSSRDRVRSRIRFKQVLHLTAGGEQQVPVVLGLVDGVVVAEPAHCPAGQVQAEAQVRGVDPPVAGGSIMWNE